MTPTDRAVIEQHNEIVQLRKDKLIRSAMCHELIGHLYFIGGHNRPFIQESIDGITEHIKDDLEDFEKRKQDTQNEKNHPAQA